MRAWLFPGQGAQKIGMGKALADAFPDARTVFEEVDDALGEKLSALIWEGDQSELTLTANAQPALMAVSLAAMRALEARGVAVAAGDFVAGHSLGEYSALTAAGGLGLADAARLLRIRGAAMQRATPPGVGAMAALLGLDFAAVSAIAAEAAAEAAAESADAEICRAANDNDPAQVVVSGHRAAVERAVALAKERGAKRAVMLPVSAPFHCPLMQPAADRMAQALADADIAAPICPLVSNVRARGVSQPETIRALLIEQVTAPVRWRESIDWMAAQGVVETVEVGAGGALSGMVRRTAPQIAVHTVNAPDDVAGLAGAASNHKQLDNRPPS